MFQNTTATQDKEIQKIINNKEENISSEDIQFLLNIIKEFDSKIEKQKDEIQKQHDEITEMEDRHSDELEEKEEKMYEKLTNFIKSQKDAPADVVKMISENIEDFI